MTPALVVPVLLLFQWFSTASGSVFKKSKGIPGTSIEYRKTAICETNPNVASFAGYVRLTPASTSNLVLSNISAFFWFFSARHNAETAPLVLYLAGGPGLASTYSALTENGPCYALDNGNATMLNPFSFNEKANVLYVDQPNGVGFSYDEVVAGVLDVLDGAICPRVLETNLTRIAGAFSSQKPENTANTTATAARTMWHFLQVWFAEFDEYHGPKDTLNIWGHSYGGAYAASLATHIQHQNTILADLSTTQHASYRTIHVPTLGVANGYFDLEAQVTSYANYAYNNSYNFRIFDNAIYQAILSSINRPDGCISKIHACRTAKATFDPDDFGNDPQTLLACGAAGQFCLENVLVPFYALSNVSEFDIAAPTANPYPPLGAASFLNQPWVRQHLGVPSGLNFTLNSKVVNDNFLRTADSVRYEGAKELGALLEQGVQVALVAGDRDWKCNWLGLQNLTLTLPISFPFRATTPTPLLLPTSPRLTALTRQHALLSLTLVLQSGHSPSWYAPWTTQTILTRAVYGRDIATGTRGTGDACTLGDGRWEWVSEELPRWGGGVKVRCSLWDVGRTCSRWQREALAAGSAVVGDGWRVLEPSS